MRRTVCLFFSLFLSISFKANAQESKIHADLRLEGEDVSKACTGFSSFFSCTGVFLTDTPLHVAIGSLPPQNGFGVGPAFVTEWKPNDNWLITLNADGIVSTNASWREGTYLKFVHVPTRRFGTTTGNAKPKKVVLSNPEYSTFDVYQQVTDLNQLLYFGLGPDTARLGRSFFGLTESIIGAKGGLVVSKDLNLKFIGEVNGRFPEVHSGSSAPSTQQAYTDTTAPGLTHQPGFIQFGEGIRFRPRLLGDYLRLNYSALYRQYIAPSDSANTFERFTVDLSHQIPLWRKTTRTLLPLSQNGPDQCSPDVGDKCPQIRWAKTATGSRNVEGSINLRFFMDTSQTPAGHVVPFYFQPTLGGKNIDGEAVLPTYDDYRFRAPNVLLLQGRFEHSIWGPIGATFQVDEGKVALTTGDLSFDHLRHGYAAGLTLRAGGFPEMWLMFGWGGHEGNHFVGSVNTSLLGGEARPSLR